MQNDKKVVELNLSDVLPNRFQPRIKFDENAINELALSIQKYGVIQPIVVRQIGNKYEIIAGERRYKASKVAGKQTIPAIISEMNDKDSVEIALIENVQREDLTPIEKAVSYKKILDMGYINQEDLAKRVGKSQSAVANTLRLLNLTDEVQEALLDNKISERHARSLLKLKEENQQIEMLNRIINERLTVRKTDEEIDKMLGNKPEDIVQIPDTAVDNMSVNNPGFMNIDKIENEAKDIIQPDKPAINMDNLMQPTNQVNLTQESKPIENEKQDSFGKFFNFFEEPKPSNPVNNNSFNLENMFNTSNNASTFETPSVPEVPQPTFEVPSMPEVSQPTFETPSMPEAQQPTFGTPSMPEVSQPTFEAPSMPEAQQPAFDTPSMPEVQQPAFEAPSMPEAQQPAFGTPSMPEVSQPKFEVPSMPEVQQPTFGTPSMPEVQQPAFDTPSMPEVSQPTFDTPSMPEVQQATYGMPNIPDITPVQNIVDTQNIQSELKPLETSIDVGNTNVETFTPPQENNVPNPTSSVKAAVPNIKIALNTIRECENTLEKYGFNIDVEEIDFEDSYQVIFKIEK